MKFTDLTVYFPKFHCPKSDLWVARSYQLNIIFDYLLAGVAVTWMRCAPSPRTSNTWSPAKNYAARLNTIQFSLAGKSR